MNVKFILRGLALALPLTIILALVGLGLILFVGPVPDPTPLPPTILVPGGDPPSGLVGLQEWAQYRDGEYHRVGSGFLLRLSDGQIVGVTTAHSLVLGNPDRPLQHIAFGVTGETDFIIEFDTLRGDPGRARTGDDLTVDYVLLQPPQPLGADTVLSPDLRGVPQPGERVWLINSRAGADVDELFLAGTVQSVSDTAVWVLMDELSHPGMLSGTPFVSQHTGQAVGMLIAGSLRGHRLLLGAHPIDSIVQLAESADKFPTLIEYRP
jgi:hypothetical protein